MIQAGTAPEWMNGIETIADARARILILLAEISELNKDIEYYQSIATQPGVNSQECWQARHRAVIDRDTDRDAIKYLEHWIRAETQRESDARQAAKWRRTVTAQEQKQTAERRQAKATADISPEDRAANLAQKHALTLATQIKAEQRKLQIEREERALSLLLSAQQEGVAILLASLADLVLRLISDTHAILTTDEQALVSAVRPILAASKKGKTL